MITQHPIERQDIEVLPLSDHEWRVSDSALAEREGLGLLGFIERTGGSFEVMRLGAPLERNLFGTMREAVDFLSTPMK